MPQVIIISFSFLHADTENIKLVFCAVKDTIMQAALKEFGMAWNKSEQKYRFWKEHNFLAVSKYM